MSYFYEFMLFMITCCAKENIPRYYNVTTSPPPYKRKFNPRGLPYRKY